VTSAPFQLEQLGTHTRDDFACGEPALDDYLKRLVSQDVRRRVTACFLAVETETRAIAGYYTLAATSIALHELPTETTKRLPRYPSVPAVRIGRLAVDQRFQKRGLGAALLADAARRSMQSPPAVFALVVDAKHDAAAQFYEHHGLKRLQTRPLTLFLALATAERAWLTSG
jgi:ribosomal protein S18 acetylase RimI-like enzyme